MSNIHLSWEWAQKRLPMFFIVDDPAPCLNLAYYEQYFEKHERNVPNSFTEAWADLIQEFGVRGKFSVLPIPAAIGRIDRPLPDVPPAEQARFLKIIRERVEPQMDICIEFLTHFLAWDIRRDHPLDHTEKTMGPFTDRARLTEYFAYGLNILQAVGLHPTGATSPGYSCKDIEDAYQAAIRDAIRETTGRKQAWYFLHVDAESPRVLPRVMSLDSKEGTGCVAMVSAAHDPSWDTQFEKPSDLDYLITADGARGRLVDLFRNRSVIGFHTHWQSLFSEGRETGLRDLRVTLGRIQEHFGSLVRWTKCSELATYFLAQATATYQATEAEKGWNIALKSPIACPDFTATAPLSHSISTVFCGDRELKRLPDYTATLEPFSWSAGRESLSWCADLPLGEVTMTLTR